MLVIQIADQLGNQMFAYASVKSIAQQRGEEFGLIRAQNNLINDNDIKYGNEIHTIFPNIKNEFLQELPENITHIYREIPLKQRKTNYQKSALKVSGDTLMIGHYISYQYFSDNLKNVYQWFAFPSDIDAQVQSELAQLQKKYPNRPLVAVHFRVGKDYMKQGFKLQDKYWLNAAEKVVRESSATPLFLLFYDQRYSKKDIISKFAQKYDCKICRGSLVHDLCMMSRCKKQIICNSSFSIMSAVLNQNSDKEILRPSVYPVGLQFQPQDCFAEDWTIIPAKQSVQSYLNCILMHIKRNILRVLKRR